MRALRLHGPRDVRLDDVPEPLLRPGTVKVKVEWAGICGTDLHSYLHDALPEDYVNPTLADPKPFVLGHEFSGRVVEIADDVPAALGLEEGTLIAAEPLVSDGTCAACLRGEYNLCDAFGFIGVMGGGGGMSEYVVIPAEKAHIVPAGITPETAALVEPLTVSWHAVRRSGLGVGGTAVVVGGGPIGLGLLLAAKAQGAGFVAVSEVSPARKEIARALGADLVLDPTVEDVVARVHEAVPGGVDASFEASGAGKPAVDALIGVLRKGGTAVTVAAGRPAEFDPNRLMMAEINFTGSFGYNGPDFPAVITAISEGRLDPSPLVSDRIVLEEAPEKGYQELVDNAAAHVKVLVRP
ncbi:zinc-binding dehydrogenase [Streptomyces sp. NPDC088747]|uniref:zinc-binding dehydrogenase n=1 Tax=Streptomyces sp. NPDC088747 TaxID=3365886 RepID=UPI00381AF7C1